MDAHNQSHGLQIMQIGILFESCQRFQGFQGGDDCPSVDWAFEDGDLGQAAIGVETE